MHEKCGSSLIYASWSFSSHASLSHDEDQMLTLGSISRGHPFAIVVNSGTCAAKSGHPR